MSELTPCNYCNYQAMKRRAEKRGVTVILSSDENGWVSARYSDKEKPSRFFLKLTESCVC